MTIEAPAEQFAIYVVMYVGGIARFDGPRFPLDVPCPEAAVWAATP